MVSNQTLVSREPTLMPTSTAPVPLNRNLGGIKKRTSLRPEA